MMISFTKWFILTLLDWTFAFEKIVAFFIIHIDV